MLIQEAAMGVMRAAVVQKQQQHQESQQKDHQQQQQYEISNNKTTALRNDYHEIGVNKIDYYKMKGLSNILNESRDNNCNEVLERSSNDSSQSYVSESSAFISSNTQQFQKQVYSQDNKISNAVRSTFNTPEDFNENHDSRNHKNISNNEQLQIDLTHLICQHLQLLVD